MSIQTLQDRQRDHYTAVPRRAARPTEKIGDVPDDIAVFTVTMDVRGNYRAFFVRGARIHSATFNCSIAYTRR